MFFPRCDSEEENIFQNIPRKWKIANFTIIIPTLNNHNIFLSIWKCLYLKVKCLFCWWYDMCNVLYNQLFMVLWQVTKYYGHYYYQLKQGHLVRDINRNKYLKLSWQLLISLYFLLLKVYKHKQIMIVKSLQLKGKFCGQKIIVERWYLSVDGSSHFNLDFPRSKL